ncbi:hypothetical protein ABZN20_03905 [Methylococcus sp. ANG]
MTDYRRFYVPGATWFFTVNLAEREGNRLLVERIEVLREAFLTVRAKHTFRIDAVVVLPDHLHCIWTLPAGDSDFSTRWGLIKSYFARHIDKGERISASRAKRGQKRFVATPFLGAFHSRRWGLPAAYRLHPLESRKTWLGGMRERLAVFQFTQPYAPGNVPGELGQQHRFGQYRGRGTTGMMRFVPHRILQPLNKET